MIYSLWDFEYELVSSSLNCCDFCCFPSMGKGKSNVDLRRKSMHFPKTSQCQGSTRCLHSWRNPMWAFTTSSAVFWQTYWLDMRFSQCSRLCSPLISDSKQTKSPLVQFLLSCMALIRLCRSISSQSSWDLRWFHISRAPPVRKSKMKSL